MIPPFHIYAFPMCRVAQCIINRHNSECSNRTNFGALVALPDIRKFLTHCFCKLGATKANSETVAEAIVQADYTGVIGEGVYQLECYIQEVQDCICDPKAEPTIEHDFVSVALVNGNNAFGPVTGKFCMDIAINKALETGSNYYGMASIYSRQAAEKGLIGLSFSNGVPQMVPPGGQEAALGANPLSVAAPTADCDGFVLDMCTTAASLAKIKNYKRMNVKLPQGLALNDKGGIEEDPEEALKFNMFPPMGGDQNYKGYGLAMFVEVLSGLLAGSNYGPKIPKEQGKKEPPNLGHSFIAVNPEKFIPDFHSRLAHLLNYLRNMEPVDPKKPVLVPGDPERKHMEMVDSKGGIRYSKDQLEVLEKVSKKFDIQHVAVSRVDIEKQKTTRKSRSLKTKKCEKKSWRKSEVIKGCPNIKTAPTEVDKTIQLITPVEEAGRFMVDCLKAVGCPEDHAKTVADHLVEADSKGHYSHGMNRLEKYIRDIQNGLCDGKATCCIDNETVSTAVVNGNNGLGAVVGKYCMDLAIEKAKETGIGLVVAHGSNHYGISGTYAVQAVNQGLLGMSFTNTSPLMAPHGAKEVALGTNPLALGAPGLRGESFLLDMTTTAVALGKIELAKRKGVPIPKGWALNEKGEMETDPEVASRVSKLMPLGGSQLNTGYKGYGLGIVVDVFSGILSGSKFGPFVRKWGAPGKEAADLGQTFIAINPNHFTEGFEKRMSDLMDLLRNIKSIDPNRPIVIHGDLERMHIEKVKKDGGFLYVKQQHDANAKLAEELKVKPMVSKNSG